tara:strand:- start:1900 stop:2829 length:930 start_codon:yes stop_codon:yes gene_type:complete
MWPKYRYSKSFFDLLIFNLQKLFSFEDIKEGNHIFVPSARYAIANILNCFEFQKKDMIAVGPFSNQCIYNSVGFISTPVPSKMNTEFEAQLIYHMFGYTYKSNLNIFTIEDSVDTYLFDQKELFQNNGRFEIISLPKVTSFCSGAIIYCKNKEDQKKLNLYFNLKKRDFTFNLQFYLMMLNNAKFDFRKNLNHYKKKMPLRHTEFLSYVYFQSHNYEKELLKKIEFINDFIEDKPLLSRRLPSSVSLKININKAEEIIKKFPFLYVRTINNSFEFTKWELEKKIFLPINQDISISTLSSLKYFLKKNEK